MADPSAQKLKETCEKAVLEASKWVDSVVWALALICATITLVKLTGATAFQWQGVTFNTARSWIVILLLTIAHAYAVVVFTRAVNRYWEVSSPEDRRVLFSTITASGGLLVRGMTPRFSYSDHTPRFQLDDPTLWTASLGSVLVIASIAPFSNPTWANAYLFMMAAILNQANIIIGTHHLICLSDLSLGKKASVYRFQRRNWGLISLERAKYIDIPPHVTRRQYPFLFLIEGFWRTIFAPFQLLGYTGKVLGSLILRLRRGKALKR